MYLICLIQPGLKSQEVCFIFLEILHLHFGDSASLIPDDRNKANIAIKQVINFLVSQFM